MLGLAGGRMSTSDWTSASDEELVAGLTARDERAVEALLSRHWASAWRVAQQLTGDAASAEDVAQEALVRVLQAEHGFAPGAAFRPWFFTIVRNAAKDQVKREQRRAVHEAGASVRRTESEDGVERDEVATVVRGELARLKPEQREVVSLHYVAGLTLQEIASVLGCPFGTVSSRLGRGLTALKKALPAGVAVGAGVIVSAAGEASAAPRAATLLTRATTSEAARPLAPPVAKPAPAAQVTRLGSAAALVVATVGVAALALGALLGTTPEDPPQAPPPAVATSPAGTPDATFDVADGAGEPPEKPVAPAPPDDEARPDARDDARPDARPDARDQALRGRVTFQGAPRAGVRVALGAASPAGETVTDAAGAFALAVSDPPPEHLTLTLWVPERGLATELMPPEPHGVLVWFRIGPAGPARDHLEVGRVSADELELHVCSTTVAGRAVDAKGGAPIAGARVALIGTDVATDADGRFELVAPRAVHGARLVATHPERAPEVRQLDRARERVDDVLLTLEPPLTLEGQVLDPQGRPAAGAEVTAHDPLPLGRGAAAFPVLRRRTLRADASGRFRVDGLHPAATLNVGRASAFVVVVYPGCLDAQASLEGDGREVTLIPLAAAHEVTGRVLLPDGAPAAGAVVVPFPTAGSASRRFSTSSGPDDALDDEAARLPGATRADAQGRFGVRLQPGPRRLLVHAGVGLADRVVQVTAPTDASLEVVLGPSASLEGRVTGEGVRGLVVTAYPAGDRGRPTIPLAAATTDAEGRFVLTGLEPAARVDVVVTTTSSSQAEAEATDVSVGATLELARRALPRETYVTVDLQVVAAGSGEPLPDAWLMTRAGLMTCEDGDGRFTHPLPVEAGASGALALVGAPGRLPVVVGPLEGGAPLRTVSLSAGAGRVEVAVDVGDLTVRHADVEWRDPGTGRRCSTQVTARGGLLRATLDGVTPGACEVRARVWVSGEDAPRTATTVVAVPAHQTAAAELTVR